MEASTNHSRNPNRRRCLLLLAALSAATCLLFVLASCRPAPKPGGPSLQAIRAEITAHAGQIVGNAACAPCHANECRVFAISAHANTLHLLNASTPSLLKPPEGRIGQTPFAIRRVADRYSVEYPQAADAGVQLGDVQQENSIPLPMVIGTGRKVVAYVNDAGNGRIFFVRFGYSPRSRQWFKAGAVSRSIKAKPNEPGGMMPDGSTCIGCHALETPPPDSLTPPPDRAGIGCETCHGPGGAHVIAMQRHLWSEPNIDGLKTQAAKQVQALCGRCHRLEQNLKGTPIAFNNTIGQPQQGHATAFATSRCYRESQGKLSCTTCHDPHTDVDPNIRTYETICLNCHSGQKPANAEIAAKAVSGHVCPVNRRNGCISCHMPQHEMMPDFDTTTRITSHYIGIYRKPPGVSEAARTEP